MRLDDVDSLAVWAESGAMALTGRPGQPPLGPPALLVPGLTQLATALVERAAAGGAELELNPMQMLCDRAALAGYGRLGAVSCGGATRLVQAADGWIAVSLAREEDVESVPAWLELGALSEDPWPEVEARAHGQACADLVTRARLLGMPVAPLGQQTRPGDNMTTPVSRTTVSGSARPRPFDEMIVVDLSSLWAGPLCSHILGKLGARVIKVEARNRPDGSRSGSAHFFDLLNGGKEGVAFDFRASRDIEVLRRLLSRADIVIEGSRPRALEQLGIVATDILVEGPTVWVSITGYGRTPPGRDWVAFGDDAAVAGGLVAWDEEGPCFCVDAVADPLTGVWAAAATVDALARGQAVLLDVAMSRVSAALGGPTLAVPDGMRARTPVARRTTRLGPQLGEHNDVVFGELSGQT